jgi:hypothetical protein
MGQWDGGEAAAGLATGRGDGSTAETVRNDGHRARAFGRQGKRSVRNPRRAAEQCGRRRRRGGGEEVCVRHMDLFRIAIGQLPHVPVFPAFNRFGHSPRLLVACSRFAGAQDRFAVYHRGGLYITQRRWVGVGPRLLRVRRVVPPMGRRIPRGKSLAAERASLFVGQAPTRGNANALRVFAEHNVQVVLFPPHLTHVLQPVDLSWGGDVSRRSSPPSYIRCQGTRIY